MAYASFIAPRSVYPWQMKFGAGVATYIVAANDSVNKRKADYVCDGTADEVQINAALAELALQQLNIADPEESIAAMLLADVKHIFEIQQLDKIHSDNLVKSLNELEERPWNEWKMEIIKTVIIY